MKRLFTLCILLIISLLAYGMLYEPYTLQLTTYHLKHSHLIGIKLIFISDFHFGPSPFEMRRGKQIVKTVNKQKPDLVIMGGDYVNGHKQESAMPLSQIASLLQQIKSPSVAVLGNHDSYYGKDFIKQMLIQSGISVLDNNNLSIELNGKRITLAGVSDYYTDTPDISKALQSTEKPIILISHSPDIFPQIDNNVDLVLAGHTHGGQIVLPFLGAPVIPSDFGDKYRYGLIYEKNTPLIVTRGLGTSLIPIRFNASPEIISIEFN